MAEIQLRMGGAQTTTTETVPSKRQRRPSVRLAEIGQENFYEPYRRSKQGKRSGKETTTTRKASRTRTSENFDGDAPDGKEGEKELNYENLAIGSWRTKDSKSKKGVKRPRTNLTQKHDKGRGNNKSSSNNDDNGGEEDEKLSGGSQEKEVEENVNEEEEREGAGYVRDSETEEEEGGSKSLIRRRSPVHTVENLAITTNNERELVQYKRHGFRPHQHNSRATKRVGGTNRDPQHDGDSDDQLQGVELDETSDNDGREENVNNNNTSNSNGVKIWLDGLGLRKYWPVFEIHEVDEEVLPLLTLEDLKDMGINAVGSRRKLFCAIQKLGEGFL